MRSYSPSDLAHVYSIVWCQFSTAPALECCALLQKERERERESESETESERERARGGEKVTKRESERENEGKNARDRGRQTRGGIMQHYCANNHIILSRT
jgi:hypothetical protein